MNEHKAVTINRLPSGVPGFHEILGGGHPESSFDVIADAPGCRKTRLAHQSLFANALAKRPALYLTVLGEPTLKMLRYHEQYTFFHATRLNNGVHFVNLSQVLVERGLQGVLDEISSQMAAADASIVVVDSFRTVLRTEQHDNREIAIHILAQKLAPFLTGSEATTFLIGEFNEAELQDNPVFTVADGLFRLYQQVERNSAIRKLQIVKLRGQMSVLGMHTFRITDAGLDVFSRTLGFCGKKKRAPGKNRLSTGIVVLDEMMGGGIAEGDSLLIAGPSSAGKSLMAATQFIAAGIRASKAGIFAVFEERPEEHSGRATTFGLDLQRPLDQGNLEVSYLRPIDLSVDERMQGILGAIDRTGAKRLAIDSLAGLELALARGFRVDFRESLYRMIFALLGPRITILSTIEMVESFTELLFSSYSISFLTDDIIRMRCMEIDGQQRKIMMIVKIRSADHSEEIREYEITSHGVIGGERLKHNENLISDLPKRLESSKTNETPGHSQRRRGWQWN
jgi:circadian clock protein KaiC